MSKRPQDMTLDELEESSYHELPLSRVKKLADPFGCWMELKSPITHKEVLYCLKNNQEQLTETPLALDAMMDSKGAFDVDEARQKHIQKIAYLVKNGFDNPIDIDVGVPSMNCYVSHMIEDGNHRLAAAIIRKDKTIKCSITGEGEYAIELGLWNPNEYLNELVRRYDDDIEQVAQDFDQPEKQSPSRKPSP